MTTTNADREAQVVASRLAANANAWTARNRADGGVCDFCCRLLGGPETRSTYITAQPIVSVLGLLNPETLGAASIIGYDDPYWVACADCDPVVQQGDAATLAQHVWTTRDADRIGVPVEHLDTADELARLTELYVAFYDRDPVRHDGVVRDEPQ